MEYGDMTVQDEAAVLPKANVGNFTRDLTLASGTQAITGVGFRPSAVQFLGTRDSGLEGCVGYDGGGGSGAVMFTHPSSEHLFVAGSSIRIEPSAANNQAGIITTLDADGFTISWTKTSSPTGTATFGYMAFK